MFEVLLELFHPPTWLAMYLSVLLGISVHLAANMVKHHSFIQELSFVNNDNNLETLEIKRRHIFTVHQWIAVFIQRKERSTDDEGDHSFLLVS